MSARDLERDTAERFKRDTATHVMTVLHDDGLYRHLKFSNPKRSGYWFEIVTWPGSLAIRGDMGGGYVFSRLTDMFGFFRRNDHGISPHYWSEKLPDCGRSVREYSEDVLKALISEHLAEYEKRYPDLAAEYEAAKAEFDALPARERYPYGNHKQPVEPKSPDDLRERIAEYDADGELNHETGARQLLLELERAGIVSDTWELSLSDWDWSFLWFCHAIVHAIAQYDASKADDAKPPVKTIVTTGGVL